MKVSLNKKLGSKDFNILENPCPMKNLAKKVRILYLFKPSDI